VSDRTTAVLAYWTEHRVQLRQCEAQRSTLTNFLLVIVAGLSGFVVQQRFATPTVAVAILIVGLGVYGTLCTAKYHERAVYHLTQARALTQTLVDLGALADEQHLADARTAHYGAFPGLHKIRLHWLWTGMHLAVAGYGTVLAAVILVG
jgi:transposase